MLIARLERSVRRVALLLALVSFLTSFDLDATLFPTERIDIRISTFLLAIIIIEVARILDLYTGKILIHKYYSTRESRADRSAIPPNIEERASKTVQYIVYTVTGMVLIWTFDLNYSLFRIPMKDSFFDMRVLSIFTILLVFLIARLLSWIVTQLILFSYYRRNEVDPGRRYAINQLVTYFIYVIAIYVMLENIGLDMTVLWGGLAALLVGIGLGMQDVFKDFISGIILLSERSVEVNDVVDVNGQVGRIKKIGLRTSLMLGRDDTMLIVPNSSLVSSHVTNWTHMDDKVRFSVEVGVAYGSDAVLVEKLLISVAKENAFVMKYPTPFVRFVDFGNSSLNFELFFWSHELMAIENVKSDLRFAIEEALRKNSISIPFPQRDVWIKERPDKG